MPANTSPIFPLVPVIGRARVSAANIARDGSGTVNGIVTGSTDGTRIDYVVITSAQATAAANSAMVYRLFISDNTGANYRLFREVAQAAVTASNTAVGATQTIFFPNGLVLPSGVVLGCTQSIYSTAADQTDFIAVGGSYS